MAVIRIITPSANNNAKPSAFIARAVDEMKDYRLLDGQVDITTQETGVIAAIILFLINKEPKVSRTKLECYTILLSKLVKDGTGQDLFHWQLNNKGRIKNFKAFFEHMIERKLLAKNGSARFFLLSEALKIIQRLPVMLGNMLPYLDKLLANYDHHTAGELLEKI